MFKHIKLSEQLRQAQGEVNRLKSVIDGGEQEAVKEIAKMQAITMAPTMTEEALFKVRHIFPEWEELIGKTVTKEDTPYIMYGEEFYMVNQGHTVSAEWRPGEGTESLYSLVPEPGTIAPWVQPLGGHDAYNSFGSGLPKSDPVTHNEKTWISIVDNNVWEPGVYGWEEHTP